MGVEFFYEEPGKYANAADIMKDLNMNFIVRNMANDKYGDAPLIAEVLQHPLQSVEQIEKRQQLILTACKNPAIVAELRKIIVETSEALDQNIKGIQDSRGKHLTAETNIGIYIDTLRHLVLGLDSLSSLMDREQKLFSDTLFCDFSDSFYREETKEELSGQKQIAAHLDGFKDKGEMVLQVSIGEGFRFRDMQILEAREKARKLPIGFFGSRKKPAIVDEKIYDSSVEFINRTVLELLSDCFPFLQRWQKLLHPMKRQIAFLNACAVFYNRYKEAGMYFCIPERETKQADQLYELSLALQTLTLPVSNTVEITKYKAIVVTGANQGGKSTFLRSLGIAQVMCQAGMYVPAKAYPLSVYRDIFPHFTRREDAAMNMGKFEEELKRMGDILEKSEPDSLFLLNESFATTTEVTAFQIAMDLLHAGMKTGRTIWMVTHITTFAKELYCEQDEAVLFLSAGRKVNKGEMQYRMVEKPPENTSYGLELFDEMIPYKTKADS